MPMTTQKQSKIALIGTDSMRGKEMKNVLEREDLPFGDIAFYDPDVEEEYSKLTKFRREARVIHSLDLENISKSDIVFLAAEKNINKKYGDQAKEKNFRAIDLSETYNKDINVPLVVPGVNENEILKRKPALVANPHPVAIMSSHFFHVLSRSKELKKAIAFVLQPVSAYEEPGIKELASQSMEMLGSASVEKKVFKTQVAFNLFSQTETLDKNGFSGAEKQIVSEVRRILNKDRLPFTLSIIQAPVFHTYAVMMYFELKERSSIKELLQIFAQSSYFKPFSSRISSPASSISVAGEDKIHIGQMKRDTAITNGFWIWMIADNLRRGSVLNALEVAERMVLPESKVK